MIAEYMLKIISAIFVSIYVARYLGPEQFGILSYAVAIVAVFMVISRLGMESILVRDLARFQKQAQAFMGTAFSLMFISAVVGVLILSVLVFFFESDPFTKIYIWVIAISLVFQPFLVVDYSFQAQVKAKYSSIAKSIALAIGAMVKIYLVWIQADLFFIALAHVFDHFVNAVILCVTYIIQKQPNFLFVFDKGLIKPLLKSAWPMVLAAVSSILYMRIDQIMIKNMLDSHQLGLYAAATKIYEGWIIVPYVISISLLPAIVKLKSHSQDAYEASLTKLFALVFWSGIMVAIISTLLGVSIIRLTFGHEFAEASSVFSIVMWTAAFTALGSVTARYLTVESMEKKIAIRTLFALVINVLMNLFLIPVYGIEGAAIATLITIICANYFINYTDKELKQLLKICNDAIVLKFLVQNK